MSKTENNILRRGALACAALLVLTALVLFIFGDLNTTSAAINKLKQDDAP